MRLRKIKDAREKLEEYRDIVLKDSFAQRGNWHKHFRNENPIHFEIGTGKGKFILESALKNPGINYVGLEVSESVTLRAARKIRSENPKNLCLLNADARTLGEIFGKGEVSKIYLNFSDPWPKNRHEKRRLTSEYFLKLYREILSDSGEIELKTDNRGFFEYSLISLNNHHFRFLEVSLDLHRDEERQIITTEYEEKFINLGQNIYYLKVVK
ncbi:MAG: tRNA (guanosine(46)-N7)-methyltransferase TrmB [Bacilli bacterium]|jgi:tRNA (guanine-N7-)-methyltransferase|nr:tRNA (guanosine(46)-N7)-methyltransferase TrmB [Acholeplasmataceae bacterium]